MIYLRREAVRMLSQLYIIIMSLCRCNNRGNDYQYINTDLISSTVWRNTKQLSLWGKQVPYPYNSVSAPFHTVQNYCSDSVRVCRVIPMQKKLPETATVYLPFIFLSDFSWLRVPYYAAESLYCPSAYWDQWLSWLGAIWSWNYGQYLVLIIC